MKVTKYLAAAIVASTITLSGLKTAHGELVFEDDLNSSETAESEIQPRVKERKDLTKSEAMRRQRLREELKNEDLLTQKLEELRLKDEMKRTEELIGSGINKSGATLESSQQPVLEEGVGSAAIAQPQGAPNPALAATGVGINGAPMPAGASTAEISQQTSDENDGTRVNIGPRFGTASIMDSMYDVNAKFSLGADITVDVTDHIAFTAGYSYSSYSMGAGQTLAYSPTQVKKIEMNDNVINLGVRGNFLGLKSRVRPFAGIGFAYRKGYVNYDEQTRNYIKQYDQYGSTDVDITGFAGYLETGLEFKIIKAISLTASFRYFNMLSSRQSSPVNPNAFYNGGAYGSPYYGAAYSYGYSPYNYNDGSKERAGQSLAKNNFYQLQVGASVSF